MMGSMKSGYSFLTAAKYSVLSQYMKTGHLVYINASRFDNSFQSTKIEEVITENANCEATISTASHTAYKADYKSLIRPCYVKLCKYIHTSSKLFICVVGHKHLGGLGYELTHASDKSDSHENCDEQIRKM